MPSHRRRLHHIIQHPRIRTPPAMRHLPLLQFTHTLRRFPYVTPM